MGSLYYESGYQSTAASTILAIRPACVRTFRDQSSLFFGTELPIIQTPMADAQASELVLAVCCTDGLGSLPCAILSPEVLHTELVKLTAQTDRPFNLNFFCYLLSEPDPAREAV